MEQAAIAALVMVVSIVIMLALGFPIGLSIGAGAAAAVMVVLPFCRYSGQYVRFGNKQTRFPVVSLLYHRGTRPSSLFPGKQGREKGRTLWTEVPAGGMIKR